MGGILVALAAIVAVVWALVVFPSFRIALAIVAVLGGGGIFALREYTASVERDAAAEKAKADEQFQIKFAAEKKAFCEGRKADHTPHKNADGVDVDALMDEFNYKCDTQH
jgi:hypothetical protein